MISKLQWQSSNCHYFVLESRASSFLLFYDCTTVQQKLGPSTNILSNDSTGQESVIQVCTVIGWKISRRYQFVLHCLIVWQYNEKKLDGLGFSSKESTSIYCNPNKYPPLKSKLIDTVMSLSLMHNTYYNSNKKSPTPFSRVSYPKIATSQ